MINKTVHTLSLLLVTAWLLILSGCGGDLLAGAGSGGTGGGTVAKATYNATLEASPDSGYLINAIVFLDKNGNYRLDDDESYAITGMDGNATLEVCAQQMATCPVVVAALKGVTVDSATMQPLLADYILSTPQVAKAAEAKPDDGDSAPEVEGSDNGDAEVKEQPKQQCTVITINPLTSQLREMIASGGYNDTRAAMETLAAKLELPTNLDLLDKEIVSNSSSVQAAAKSIAALMSMQSRRVLTAAEDKTAHDTPLVSVERYRTMMKMITDNMHIVSKYNSQQNLLNLNNNITAVLEATPEKAVAEQAENQEINAVIPAQAGIQ